MTADGNLRGRWAPSPTGPVHLGNARTALVAWLAVRSRGGTFVWRVEDLDEQRAVDGLAREQAEDLAWLGLDWDEGPWSGDSAQVLGATSESAAKAESEHWQSQRDAAYEGALRRLAAKNRVFPCRLSRRELRAIASAPHGGVTGACGVNRRTNPYPQQLRPEHVAEGWLDAILSGDDRESAVRFVVEPGEIVYEDLLYGVRREETSQAVGDFVLRRRDGVWAYQLAVVVDDAAMHIDQVVRGADLLDSTARQIALQRALGLPTPHYGHVPLLLNTHGEKLSKRDGALRLSALREAGVAPERVVGFLATTLGLDTTGSLPAEALIERFCWNRLRKEPLRLPLDVDLIEELR